MNKATTFSNSRPPLAPDLDAARRHLAILDPRPGACWGFRTASDRIEDPRLAVMCFGTLDRGIRQSGPKKGQSCRPHRLLSYMQQLGAGVFVVVNELDGNGQCGANVTRIRALIADADSAEQVRSMLRFAKKVPPTMIVASGGLDGSIPKLHGYWGIEGCPVAEFTAAQNLLISRTGTDPSVKDLPRILRQAGFWHLKYEPWMTHIVAADPRIRYEYPELIQLIRAQPTVCAPVASQSGVGLQRRSAAPLGVAIAGPTGRLRALVDKHGSLLSPAVKSLIREAVAPSLKGPGNRHSTLVAITARLIQAGWQDDEIRDLVLPEANNAWGDGDWANHLNNIIKIFEQSIAPN
jgi:hypothetical protein